MMKEGIFRLGRGGMRKTRLFLISCRAFSFLAGFLSNLRPLLITYITWLRGMVDECFASGMRRVS
jgi:hypothetical protein